jgi:hypothetical protein
MSCDFLQRFANNGVPLFSLCCAHQAPSPPDGGKGGKIYSCPHTLVGQEGFCFSRSVGAKLEVCIGVMRTEKQNYPCLCTFVSSAEASIFTVRRFEMACRYAGFIYVVYSRYRRFAFGGLRARKCRLWDRSPCIEAWRWLYVGRGFYSVSLFLFGGF